MKRNIAQQDMTQTTMYTVVFESGWVKAAVCLLFGFLLLQPIAPAFASQVDAEIIEVESVTEAVQEVEAEAIAPTETYTEEVVNDSDVVLDVSANPSEVIPTAAESDVVDEVVIPEAENEPVSATSSPEEEPISDEQVSESPEEQVVDDEVESILEPSTEESTPVATTSETVSEQVLVVDHNANQLQFNPDECASVGDGAFYCSTPKEDVVFEEDGVFAAPDIDGDMEIYVRVHGEETQLTFNTVDDSAPSYDAKSDRVVWHAKYNDRYQIMSYDMSTSKETRLTDTSYNNMEPVAYGDITMYQSWLDNNWEVMLHDASGVRRLTTNTQHDVSPSIRSGYIVWQSQFADGWQVAIYHQETDQIEYVKSEGGAKVENPRFVLVYDSTNDAGDVQTLGYDFGTKRSFSLGSIPADTPDELPEPDQTGETRALIQNKQSVRDTEVEDGEITPTPSTGITTPSVSENGIVDIDLTGTSTESFSTSTPIFTEITDVVVQSFSSSTQNNVPSHIEDIVIPPSVTATE